MTSDHFRREPAELPFYLIGLRMHIEQAVELLRAIRFEDVLVDHDAEIVRIVRHGLDARDALAELTAALFHHPTFLGLAARKPAPDQAGDQDA